MKDCFKKLVLERQSCRNFNDKPLDANTVIEIAKQARLAPSACNSQPWKMYVVTSPEKIELTALALGVNGHNKFLSGAKAFIVLAEKQATLKEGVKFDRNHFVKYDVGELIAYITLTAKSFGVETCIIGMVNQDLIGNAVPLKDGEHCNIAVALGYSDSPLRNKTRKSEEEVIEII
ncbi:MAG: nitroreductase family protein [Clostridia bacterium]|nr:nitroreductase family protein [Clostridia bacterium]